MIASNTLNTCCTCHSRFRASSEPKMKKRASWNHADICTTLLLWNCLGCQSAENDGNSVSNNTDKYVTAPGYWAKVVSKNVSVGKSLWRTSSPCCCTCTVAFSVLSARWHFTMKRYTEELAWNDQDFIRFSVGCQHSELCGAAVVLKTGARTWLNIVRLWKKAAGGLHPQVEEEEEGAQRPSLSQGSAPLEEIELVKHAACPQFPVAFEHHTLVTSWLFMCCEQTLTRFQVIIPGESSSGVLTI